jgi:hypothetical protein
MKHTFHSSSLVPSSTPLRNCYSLGFLTCKKGRRESTSLLYVGDKLQSCAMDLGWTTVRSWKIVLCSKLRNQLFTQFNDWDVGRTLSIYGHPTWLQWLETCASGVIYLTKKLLLQMLCWMRHPVKWNDNSSLQTNSERNVDFSNQLGDALNKALHLRRIYQQWLKTQNPICQFLHRFSGCHMYVNAR